MKHLAVNELIQDPAAPFQALRAAIKSELHCALPGVVHTYDPITQSATIQPAIRSRVAKETGVEHIQLPLLANVPVYFPGGGVFALTMPVQPGDECLVVFADSCIDAWWQSGGVQNQIDLRSHDLSDGFAFVGFHSKPNALSDVPNHVPALIGDTDALRGPAGKSNFELWLEAGNTGTVEEYLESLRGPAGRDGEDGGPGPQGIPGVPGSDATVTKPAVEAVLKGTITSHNHSGTYAPASHSHTKANISDFPTSMPASDVYSWAKAVNKPTYNNTEVGAAPTSHNHDGSYSPTSHGHSLDSLTGPLSINKGGHGGTTAAQARENLGVTPANLRIDWKSVYNFTSGCLIETSLLTTVDSHMFLLHIKGNGYGQGKIIDIEVQGYYYQTFDTFYNLKAVAKDQNLNIRVFKYNSKVYFWFKPPSDYITIWAYLKIWNSTENMIAAITHSSMLSSGVTLDNTVTPAQVFNSSDGNVVPVNNGGTGSNNGTGACANIGAVKKSGDTMTGLLEIQANGMYLLIGPQGYGYSHYSTNGANGHWFNASIKCQGEIYAGSGYDKRVYHAGNFTRGTGIPSGGADGDKYVQYI